MQDAIVELHVEIVPVGAEYMKTESSCLHLRLLGQKGAGRMLVERGTQLLLVLADKSEHTRLVAA